MSPSLRLPGVRSRHSNGADPAAEAVSAADASPAAEAVSAADASHAAEATSAPLLEPGEAPGTQPEQGSDPRAERAPEPEPPRPTPTPDAVRVAAAAGFSPVDLEASTRPRARRRQPVGEARADGGVPIAEDGEALAGRLRGLTAVEDALARLVAFDDVVLSWIAEDGYPMNVAVRAEVAPQDDTIRFDGPAGFQIHGRHVAVTGTHVRPLPDGGFDERSHVTVWGRVTARPRGRFVLHPDRAWIWDDAELPLPAAYERRLPKARRYFEELSRERGYRVRPRMDPRQLLFRATRAPFLSATWVPVLVGLAIAAQEGHFDPATAFLTVVAASSVHLGLNAANDVFDTLAGADDANETPTRFSGGSRVIQNALISVGQMSALALACYGVAVALGLVLFALRGSFALAGLAALGVAISVGYTMPPAKLVYRGLGEVATAVGFGPVMLLGAYVVQSGGSVSPGAVVASLPIGLLVAMILYVNEIPDRAGDAGVGKRTLPVRLGKREVVLGFDAAVASAFAVVGLGAVAGTLPLSCLLALMAIPLSLEVHRGLVRDYENPYALTHTMALNIRLHFTVGVLLWFGYVAAITDQTLLHLRPFVG